MKYFVHLRNKICWMQYYKIACIRVSIRPEKGRQTHETSTPMCHPLTPLYCWCFQTRSSCMHAIVVYDFCILYILFSPRLNAMHFMCSMWTLAKQNFSHSSTFSMHLYRYAIRKAYTGYNVWNCTPERKLQHFPFPQFTQRNTFVLVCNFLLFTSTLSHCRIFCSLYFWVDA